MHFKLANTWMKCWILLLVTLALQSAAAASNALTDFDHANRAYEQGRYADAIEAYQKLARENGVSPALYFNIGNSYFKSGQTGQAIVFYRLAQRLAPRDPDIRANLRFARETVAEPGVRPAKRWERMLHLLSLDEITCVTAAALWLWFLLLTAGRMRRDWTRSLRPYARLSGGLAVVAVLWLGMLAQDRFGTSPAVVVASEAVVRYGPLDEAQSSHSLQDGAELAVLDQKGDWLQVTDGARRTGWLQAKDVVLLPRG